MYCQCGHGQHASLVMFTLSTMQNVTLDVIHEGLSRFTMATNHMEFLNIGFQGDIVAVVINDVGGMTRRNLFQIKRTPC